MKRRVGIALVALAAVGITVCALRATTVPWTEDAETAVRAAPPVREVSARREVTARVHSTWTEPERATSPSPEVPVKPEWATDDLRHVHLVAPSPDELPCGTTDCLLEDPDRHRAETREKLAYNGLADLMDHQGVPEELREDLRTQLAANLAALK